MAAEYILGEPSKEEKRKTCPHMTVKKIIFIWKCLECGQEFIPKKPPVKKKGGI